MKKPEFDKLRKILLKNGNDEQLRMIRIQIAKELEKRLESQERRFFKNPAIGERKYGM